MNEDIHIGYAGNTANAGDWVTLENTARTITGSNIYYDESSPNIEQWRYVNVPSVWYEPTPKNNNKKGDDDMRYLYEVILVNPKNDTFYVDRVVARSETSALMEIYKDSPFNEKCESGIVCDATAFDDLKTNCKVLMEWKKEKSLEKALETIKKAVE